MWLKYRKILNSSVLLSIGFVPACTISCVNKNSKNETKNDDEFSYVVEFDNDTKNLKKIDLIVESLKDAFQMNDTQKNRFGALLLNNDIDLWCSYSDFVVLGTQTGKHPDWKHYDKDKDVVLTLKDPELLKGYQIVSASDPFWVNKDGVQKTNLKLDYKVKILKKYVANEKNKVDIELTLKYKVAKYVDFGEIPLSNNSTETKIIINNIEQINNKPDNNEISEEVKDVNSWAKGMLDKFMINPISDLDELRREFLANNLDIYYDFEKCAIIYKIKNTPLDWRNITDKNVLLSWKSNTIILVETWD
ncbi:hypothetical protein [Mycoplasma sp. HS2188]|uniref:hypothetical protein n=1 Tax=Mycoplasma sp. HS2188 TaxID=2976765 RepID=UPI0021AA1995|nr:hypothetical protein [Mycoplasma sp. HS2188]MCT4469859.1 hypothetical protein [Mycoplasma sp. HS2188]